MSARARTSYERSRYERCSDVELAAFIARGERDAVRLLTQRHNRRLFRAAWSILQNRAEAEDSVQETYLRAIAQIERYEGVASLSTWLTRIAINEALMRKRMIARRHRAFDPKSVVVLDAYREKLMAMSEQSSSPETELMRKQLTSLLEKAIACLPDHLRTVFMLRDVEGLSVEETSLALALKSDTVKTRHVRARKHLRATLDPSFKSALTDAFAFAGADCEAMTERVLKRASFPAVRSRATAEESLKGGS